MNKVIKTKFYRLLIFIILNVIYLHLLSFQTFAKTIYVDQSGRGDFLTINEGITESKDGDIVKVNPGNYNENVVINKNITLIGSGPNFTKIKSQQDGIEVKYNLSSVEIIGFLVISGNAGIYFNTNYGDGTIICDIKNCIITGCTYGIYYNGDCYDYATINIINNTIVSSSKHGIYISADSSISCKTTMIGNIIAKNGYGIYIISNSNFYTTEYNNYYNNTGYNYEEYFTPGQHDISIDPKFISLETGNYALKSDSPCINAGNPSSERNDPDGTRNDMGAYSGPDAASFWPYTNPNYGPIITEMEVFPSSVSRGSKLTIKAKGKLY